jgi:hypothetical protein
MALFSRLFFVGAIGFEPTTPTVSSRLGPLLAAADRYFLRGNRNSALPGRSSRYAVGVLRGVLHGPEHTGGLGRCRQGSGPRFRAAERAGPSAGSPAHAPRNVVWTYGCEPLILNPVVDGARPTPCRAAPPPLSTRATATAPLLAARATRGTVRVARSQRTWRHSRAPRLDRPSPGTACGRAGRRGPVNRWQTRYIGAASRVTASSPSGPERTPRLRRDGLAPRAGVAVQGSFAGRLASSRQSGRT